MRCYVFGKRKSLRRTYGLGPEFGKTEMVSWVRLIASECGAVSHKVKKGLFSPYLSRWCKSRLIHSSVFLPAPGVYGSEYRKACNWKRFTISLSLALIKVKNLFNRNSVLRSIYSLASSIVMLYIVVCPFFC